MNSPKATDKQQLSNQPGLSSVHELTERNVQAIAQLEEAARQDRSGSDKFADAVAKFCGSVTFLWTHVAVFGIWMGVNTWPGGPRFDEFPYTFLSFVVSLEAIFLSTFILISQNQETRLAERRNHLDLQINLLAEQENTRILKILTAISGALGVKVEHDPEAKVLEEPTRPEALVEQIEEAVHSAADPKTK